MFQGTHFSRFLHILSVYRNGALRAPFPESGRWNDNEMLEVMESMHRHFYILQTVPEQEASVSAQFHAGSVQNPQYGSVSRV